MTQYDPHHNDPLQAQLQAEAQAQLEAQLQAQAQGLESHPDFLKDLVHLHVSLGPDSPGGLCTGAG